MPRKKPAKSSSRKTDETEERIHAACFDLIARRGWRALTLPRVARAAKVSVTQLMDYGCSRQELLARFFSFIDRKLAGTGFEGANLKERLFEVLMRRLELMRPYRAGLVRLVEDMKLAPLDAVCFVAAMGPAVRRSARLVLDLADFSASKPRAEAAICALPLVYSRAWAKWKDDESADLSPTMAALDKGLEKYVSWLGLS